MAFETTVTEIAPRIFRISQPAGAPGTSDAAPGVGRPFTNNAYLVLADSPLLYLTLYKGGAAGLLNAIDTLTNGKGVKYVALTVWANDTVGGLRKVLDKYGAELLATPALFEKYAGPKGVKRVKIVENGSVLPLGSHSLQIIHTPNLFNKGPETTMFLERTTGTLFTADLYSHCGIDVPPLADPATTLDRTNQLKFDFSDPRVPGYFEQLRGLKPRVLATMHGGAVNREVEKVMREWPEIHLGREWEKREMKEREARL